MSRSKKDGRRGGNHRRFIKDYGHYGLANGKPGGSDDFTSPERRRYNKKKVSRQRRRKSREIGFAEGETHLHTENLARLGMPTLDYRVYVAVTRAFEESEPADDLLEFLVDIAHKSELLEDTTYIQGLIALAEDNGSWIRPLETWHAETDDRGEQFSKLTRHLFAAYDVPRFMDSVWLDGNPTHQNWFKHIGGGRNIRTASGLPFMLTKKMAHHFLTAPEDYTVAEALRWGQVHALGGNRQLAEALRGTYLVRALNTHDTNPRDFWFVEDDFWISVIRFFLLNPMLNPRHANPIIDYIQHQKYIGQPPARPNFSMNGRTPETLLRQVEAWYQELHRAGEKKEKKGTPGRWAGSGIGGFRFQQEHRIWDIMELTNKKELYAEGKAMGHCASTYLSFCIAGEISMWAMAIKDEGETVWKKAVTIEVELPSRRITQVRGRFNRFPTQEEKSILERWAAKENLRIPSYIRTDYNN